MLRLLLLAAAVCVASASAQTLTLTPRADADALLPPSIRAFTVTRTGTPLQASLLRADLAATDWTLEAVFSDVGTETVPSFAADAGVFAALNGGYFGGAESYSLVREGGQTVAAGVASVTRDGTVYPVTRGAFGVSAARVPDVAWVYTLAGVTYAYPQPSPNAPGAPQPVPSATFPAGGAPWGVTTAIGGGPVLVQNGAVAVTWTEEVFFGGSGVDLTSSRARTAVGYTATGTMLLVAVPEATGLTLSALAALMVDLGAVEAVNLDGGGSTAMAVGGVTLVNGGRAVATALRLRTPTTTPPPPVGIVFDTGDAGYRETGAWIASGNSPYWGTTPSRLNAVGTGADRAVFRLGALPAGRYAVEAWWTPSTNRATNTPFTIYRAGVGQTVRMDQTPAATGNRWNAIATVDLAPNDSLVVTDDATGTATPTYICVDAIRLTPVGTTAAADAPGAWWLRVGPNPVRSRLLVETSAVGPVQAEVFDALGRRVRHETADSPLTVDVGALAPGPYLLRVSAAGTTRTQVLTVVR